MRIFQSYHDERLSQIVHVLISWGWQTSWLNFVSWRAFGMWYRRRSGDKDMAKTFEWHFCMLVSFFLKHSNGYGSVSQDAKDVLTMHSPRDASQQLCYGRAKVDRVRSTELSLTTTCWFFIVPGPPGSDADGDTLRMREVIPTFFPRAPAKGSS